MGIDQKMAIRIRLRAVIRRQLPLVMFQRRRSAAGREGCSATVTRVMLAYSSSGIRDMVSKWLQEMISFEPVVRALRPSVNVT